MTQPGGPAAINGFLYQILQHLSWMLDVRLSGRLAGQDVKDARLILEPHIGGDAQALTSGLYLVEQYKTRADKTWPLSEVMDVLRNLRQAVSPSLPDNARYRFVTDGRPGRLKEFERFLAALKSVEHPDQLDNFEKRKFNNTLCRTDRNFFSHIVEITRGSGDYPISTEEKTIVFHLLSRFQMVFSLSGVDLAETIEQYLRPYVPDLNDERGIRERLVGCLMEELSKGQIHLNPDDLNAIFQHVGLSPERLRRMEKLNKKMGEMMRRRMRNLKYVHRIDVRDAPICPESKRVLLVAGESGAGKTWQLGKFMETNVREGRIVVFINPANSPEEVLTDAARAIWQYGLGETSDKSLQAVSNIFNDYVPRPHSPLFTIAIDDIQNIALARNLVRQDWTSLSARLVLTVPLTLSQALNQDDSEAIHIHHVDGFTIDELDALLKMHQLRWVDLPSDLKRLLCKPILAGLFLKVSSGSIQYAPQSEYEIFKAFWERISARSKAGDTGIVLALAAHAHEGNLYPLPRERWGEIGLNNESLASLEAVGWLRCNEYGEVVFAHDRLLNWAVAQDLERQFSRKKLSINELSARLTRDKEGQSSYSPSQFGYVLMDVLWLLTADDSNVEAVSQLIETMENQHELGGDCRYFYTKLLPTLGYRVVPILLKRLNTITVDSFGDYRVGLISDAFVAIVQHESVDLQNEINSLLNSSSWDLQSVAVKILTTVPHQQYLNRLWEIHQQLMDAREHNSDLNVFKNYQVTHSALRAGLRLHPEWFRERILNADPNSERITELAYLLSGLDAPSADNIWLEVRDVLMEKVPTNKPRSLLHCIARFEDREKIDFVVNHLTCSEEFVASVALVALAILDPRYAIDQIVNLNDQQKYFTNEWLALLLHVSPELTRQRIRQLAQSNPVGERLIESYFTKRPADLDEATLQLVLRKFESDLKKHFQDVTTSDRPWTYLMMKFLGNINSPQLIQKLQEEADGELERMITEIACSRLRGNSRVRDNTLEAARRVLFLIGGNGIFTLINRELASEHFWVRHGGLNCALMIGDEETIKRLSGITQRSKPLNGNRKLESNANLESYQSMVGLAAQGADEILVEILMKSRITDVPYHLAHLRAYRGPIPKTLTDQAVRMMQSTETSEDLLLCSLLTAWLSGDTDLIPTVRDVLRRVKPGSQVASYACTALQYLGDESDEFVELAVLMAHTEQNFKQGLEALIQIGDKTQEFLESWLREQCDTPYKDHSHLVIRALYNHAESRELAVEVAAKHCLHNHIYAYPLYEIAAESDDPNLREMILADAFDENSVVVTLPLEAMRGLAKFDPDRATEAIELGLQWHPKIERQLCRLLVQIMTDSAAERLIEAVISIKRETLPQAVGRALRRLDPINVSNLIIEKLSGAETEREVVIKIASWLPIPEITQALGYLVNYDNSIVIRRVALEALYAHRQEKMILALFTEFQNEDCDAHRWSIFTAILESVDPFLLTEPNDPLWLGHILTENVPFAFEHHAREVVKKRKRNS